MQPIQVTVTALSGDVVQVSLAGGGTVELPRSAFPNDVKEGESLSLLAIRGVDILNEVLRDEEAGK
ncbi:MAG: hypothetical protein AAB558_00830 [Patescibacteria group bacterium]